MYYQPTLLAREIRIDTIYTVHFFEYHKDYVFAGESHPFWELLYIDWGEADVTAGERHLTLTKGQMILHKPDEFHAIAANRIVAPNTVVVSFECKDDVLCPLADRVFMADESEKGLLARIVQEAGLAFENELGDPTYRCLVPRGAGGAGEKDFAAQQMLRCLLEMLLISLIRRGKKDRIAKRSSGNKYGEERVAQLVDWIRENVSRTFELTDICERAMVNKSTLERVFRQQTGMSIIEYCRAQKIEAAKRLLREEGLNVTEIAEKLGFSSVHYFSRTFRLLTGMSPREYAASIRSIVDHSETTNR